MIGPLDYRQRAAICDYLDRAAQDLNTGAEHFDQLGMAAVAQMLGRAAVELGCAAWVVWAPCREGVQGPPRWPAETDGYPASAGPVNGQP